MIYLPNLTDIEISENHRIFTERLQIYKKEGLDFFANREYVFAKAKLDKSKVLDIGTGRGLTAFSLADAGHDVVTIDIDEEILKIAALNIAYKKLLPKVQLYHMDAYSMDFEDESFGAVFMIEAMHHVEDPKKILGEIGRVLISGGKIVLSDFNDKGMSIVDKVHKREGNEHTNLSKGLNVIKEWMVTHGYEVEEYNDNCHWVIIAKKGINENIS